MLMRCSNYYSTIDRIERIAKSYKISASKDKSKCKLAYIELKEKELRHALKAIHLESGIALEKKIIDLV